MTVPDALRQAPISLLTGPRAGVRELLSPGTDIRTENATPIMGEIYILEQT